MASQPHPEVLPRGRHAPPQAVVAASQRARLITAMAELVAANGYAATSVADVLLASRVSRRSFYEHFSSKEDCFLRACEHGVAELFAHITTDIQPDSSIGTTVASGISAYLRSLQNSPAFAQIFLVEILGAGPSALERRSEVLRDIATIIRGLHRGARPTPDELPEHRYFAATAAVNEIVADHVRRLGTEHLGDLEPVLLDVVQAMLTISGSTRAP